MVPPYPTLVAWSLGSWGPGQFPGTAGGNRFFLAQGSGLYQHAATPGCQAIGPNRGAQMHAHRASFGELNGVR